MKRLLLVIIFTVSSLSVSQSQPIDVPIITGESVCRCHGESCQGGNQISLRRSCGRITGTGDCGVSPNC